MIISRNGGVWARGGGWMCCRHSLAGSKQGKSRDCSRSGSKQQRRQERHFLVPTCFSSRPPVSPSVPPGCQAVRRPRRDSVRRARGGEGRRSGGSSASRLPPGRRCPGTRNQPPRAARPGPGEPRPAGTSLHFLLQPRAAPPESEQ